MGKLQDSAALPLLLLWFRLAVTTQPSNPAAQDPVWHLLQLLLLRRAPATLCP